MAAIHRYQYQPSKVSQENMAGKGRQPLGGVGGKTLFKVPGVTARPALGSIQNNITDQTHGPMKQKASFLKPVEPPGTLLPLVESKGHKSREEEVIIESGSSSPESMDVVQISEAFSEQLNIHDIDTQDADNPQLCADYAKDIYEYMREIECQFHIPPSYMEKQPHVNDKMRAILVDWLIQVHHRFTLLQETLYLTVSIIDRYLKVTTITKDRLQLVGVTAMLIASKYEEMYAPEVRDFVYITDNTYSVNEIKSMEREMLKALNYSFGNPLCLHFLRRNSRAGDATPQMHTMAKFLMEICLPEYTMLEYLPSCIAASALYIANKLYSDGQWTPALKFYSVYSESDILPCVSKIATLVLNMSTCKQQAVKNKYSSSKFLRIAKEPCLQGSIMKELSSLSPPPPSSAQ